MIRTHPTIEPPLTDQTTLPTGSIKRNQTTGDNVTDRFTNWHKGEFILPLLVYNRHVQHTQDTMHTYKVNVITEGAGGRHVMIEAVNRPQAREFAEARYPGCRIGSVNQV